MKIGDLIECRETSERGVIVRTRLSFGTSKATVITSYGIDWFTANLDKPAWIDPAEMKVIKSYE